MPASSTSRCSIAATTGPRRATARSRSSTSTARATPASPRPSRRSTRRWSTRDGTADINGGQPASQLTLGFYNFGYEFDDFEIYSFGDVSYRHGDALQGYRVPNRVCRTAAGAAQTSDPTRCFGTTAQTGLVPHIEVKQNEFSFTGGVRGDASGWNWDLSGTYAEDVVGGLHDPIGQRFAVRQHRPVADRLLRRQLPVQPVRRHAGRQQGVRDRLCRAADLRLWRRIPRRILHHRRRRCAVALRRGRPVLPRLCRRAMPARSVAPPRPSMSTSSPIRWRTGRSTLPAATSTTATSATRGSARSPRATISRDAFAVRATASTGFRAPTLAESGLFGHQRRPDQRHPAARAQFARFGQRRLRCPGAGRIDQLLGRHGAPSDRPAGRDARWLLHQDQRPDRVVGRHPGPAGVDPVPVPGVPVLTPLINGLTPYQLVLNAIAASGKALDPTVLQSGSSVDPDLHQRHRYRDGGPGAFGPLPGRPVVRHARPVARRQLQQDQGHRQLARHAVDPTCRGYDRKRQPAVQGQR